MNYVVLSEIFIPLYTLCLAATVFTVRNDTSLSVLKDASPERDKALLINGHFLLFVTFGLMRTASSTGTIIWLFVTYGIALDLLFRIPNYLSKFWTWIFIAIAILGSLAELVENSFSSH